MARAKAAGVPGERIVFSGVGKTREQLEAIEPGAFGAYMRYLAEGQVHYEGGVAGLVEKNFRNPLEFLLYPLALDGVSNAALEDGFREVALENIVLRPTVNGLHAELFIVVPGQQDDRGVRRGHRRRAQQPEACHTRGRDSRVSDRHLQRAPHGVVVDIGRAAQHQQPDDRADLGQRVPQDVAGDSECRQRVDEPPVIKQNGSLPGGSRCQAPGSKSSTSGSARSRAPSRSPRR